MSPWERMISSRPTSISHAPSARDPRPASQARSLKILFVVGGISRARTLIGRPNRSGIQVEKRLVVCFGKSPPGARGKNNIFRGSHHASLVHDRDRCTVRVKPARLAGRRNGDTRVVMVDTG